MFVGEFAHQVDANGRVTLPATFRGLLDGECYLRRDPDGYLLFLPPDAYQNRIADIEDKIRSGEAPSSAMRAYTSKTRKITIDKNGRFTLDEEARQHAGLRAGAPATFVGEGPAFSVWRPSRWTVLDAEDSEATPVRVWEGEDD
ncbi:MAG TPA: hypothetical protein VNQ73_06195 [Ilumatobacter sp.]|nr:hypothetical protein [Ilumatobacter sp.]